MRHHYSLLGLSACGVAALLLPAPGFAQIAPAASKEMSLSSLLAIEKTLDARRQELHVPGVAFAIVKDDKIIYSHGFGMRDVANQRPVTADTLFAIGSSTKAFTAMTMMMSADEGKLALTDSPRKFLPYFHLQDPDADQHITLSDLLSHRSGLARTDLLWANGALNSEQLIRALGDVKPTAKLGEKFQYQNLMFLTAGQIVGKVQGTAWTNVVKKRILRPLGMSHTDLSIQTMQKADDYALGYTWDEEKKDYTHVPMRRIDLVAPAGAINSNVKDMAKWVQFMLDGGVWNGKRLISERNFAELTMPRITVAGDMKYGYGWFLRDWNGHKVVEHGGNIDGFNAEVALMPDQHLGFVMLTNVSASSLGETAQTAVWDNLVGRSDTPANAGPPVTPQQAMGAYHSEEAGIDFQVVAKDGVLTAQRIGSQNILALQPAGTNRYKLGSPAPEGTFISFHLAKDGAAASELVLEQSGTKVVFQRAKPTTGTDAAAPYDGPLKELIGLYKAITAPLTLEVAVRAGKVVLLVPGQPAYPLVEKVRDNYALGGLPADFGLLIKRDAAGKVVGATLKQPVAQGDLELAFGNATPATDLPPIEEVMQKYITAMGGEAALRRHHSQVVEMHFESPTQGVTGTTVIRGKAPTFQATDSAMFALKKKIFMTHDIFDGQTGAEESSLSPLTPKSKQGIAAAKIAADFYRILHWKSLYKSVTVMTRSKVGEETCYVVSLTPPTGKVTLLYLSTQSFLPLKQETAVDVPGVGTLISTEIFSDYRAVDGVKIPFRRVASNPLNGETVTTVTKIRYNVSLPDSMFRMPAPPAM